MRARWPLLALLALAAALRFATLDLQSLWFDEAFTPTHVLHHSLAATLRAATHTENSPPLYYALLWAWTRALGTGAVALRSLSALAGVALVAVAWEVGRTMGGRRAALITAALVAVNPLLVWYSQEARAYALFALFAALAFMFFMRAYLPRNRRDGDGDGQDGDGDGRDGDGRDGDERGAEHRGGNRRELWGWAACSMLALLTHYFAVFLIAPQALLLVAGSAARRRRAALAAVVSVVVVGLGLIPLVASQAGHGTQWIGHWALADRLLAIPRYYLLGPSGAPLGNGLLLAAAAPVLAAIALSRRLSGADGRAALIGAGVGAAAIVVPLILALAGADYLAPRNLIGAAVPLTGALAVVLAVASARRAGTLLALVICIAGLALFVDVSASPRLQRGDWEGVAGALAGGPGERAIVTPGLGSAPLEYYIPSLRRLRPGASASVRELDLVGYPPLLRRATSRLPAGLRPVARRSVNGLLVLRFQTSHAVALSEGALRAHRLVRTRTEVLVPAQSG